MPYLPGLEEAEVFFGTVDAPEIVDFPTTHDEDQDADPVVTEAQHQRLVGLLGFDPYEVWPDEEE
jgi:hypothetical protein